MNKSEVKVIAILERVGGFASAQELHGLLQRNGESIGLTTVYRAIQSLVSDKIVDQLRRDDGEAIYRLCGDSITITWYVNNVVQRLKLKGLQSSDGLKLWLKSTASAKLAIPRKSLVSALSVSN